MPVLKRADVGINGSGLRFRRMLKEALFYQWDGDEGSTNVLLKR